MAKGEWITVNERSRTYHWSGASYRYSDVTRVKVSESGTHYIETADGVHAIIAPGWQRIELDIDAWTF